MSPAGVTISVLRVCRRKAEVIEVAFRLQMKVRVRLDEGECQRPLSR